ncbi:MAG: hypothetical protein ACRDHX_01460 [Chloroflexota bacterium]
MITWQEKIRRIHDGTFDVDWDRHLAALNERLKLEPEHRLSTPGPGLPPSLFTGDLTAVRPGAWALVISLNPQNGPPGGYGSGFSPDEYWTVEAA